LKLPLIDGSQRKRERGETERRKIKRENGCVYKEQIKGNLDGDTVGDPTDT
jgi:hypothetical protein